MGRQATRRDEGTWAQKLVKILGQCLAAVPQAVSPCWWGPGWDRLGPGDPLISIIKGECPRGSQIAERPTKHRSRCVGGGSQPGPNRSQPVPTAPRVPQNTGPRALGPGPNGYQMSQRPTKHRSPCVGTGSQRVPKVTTSHKTQVPVRWDRVPTGTKGHSVPQNTGPRALGPGHNGYQRSQRPTKQRPSRVGTGPHWVPGSQRPTKHRSPCIGTGSQRVPKGNSVPQNRGHRALDQGGHDLAPSPQILGHGGTRAVTVWSRPYK